MTMMKLSLALVFLSLAACANAGTKTLMIPDEMKKPPAPKKGDVPPPPAQKYIIRMAEGGRVWEMELPEESGGYALRVPLDGEGGIVEGLTAADEELLEDAARALAAAADPDGTGEVKAPKLDAKALAGKRSYLGGLAKVTAMYRSKQYELGLIELVELEKDYPKDFRILSMKGSLYVKLGKNRLAREAWEKALELNPDDAGVGEALRNLASADE